MLSSMSRWLNSVKNENALTWKALPGKSLLLHFPSSETIRRYFARRARNGAYKADWNKWISYKAFENFYALIHVTESIVYKVWLSVIIPFTKTICCYLGRRILLLLLFVFFTSFSYCEFLEHAELVLNCSQLARVKRTKTVQSTFPPTRTPAFARLVPNWATQYSKICKLRNTRNHCQLARYNFVNNVMIL